jgi:hypothetical protein
MKSVRMQPQRRSSRIAYSIVDTFRRHVLSKTVNCGPKGAHFGYGYTYIPDKLTYAPHTPCGPLRLVRPAIPTRDEATVNLKPLRSTKVPKSPSKLDSTFSC